MLPSELRGSNFNIVNIMTQTEKVFTVLIVGQVNCCDKYFRILSCLFSLLLFNIHLI